jgi:hypothetical protein
MVYLTITLLLYTKAEFINIIKVRADNIHIFYISTSRPNIIYSVVEYKEDILGRGDITAVYRLVE